MSKKKSPPQPRSLWLQYRWLIASMVVLIMVSLVIIGSLMKSQEKIVKNVDPTVIAQDIMKNNTRYLLVDVRSPSEYKKGHIRGAVNVPAYMSLKTWDGTVERYDELARSIKKNMAKGQTVVVYGHFGASALPDTITRMLAADGLSVAHLTVGWNEFAHMSALWMPEELWRVLRIDQLVVRKED